MKRQKKRYPHKRSSKRYAAPISVNTGSNQSSKQVPSSTPQAYGRRQSPQNPKQRRPIIIFDPGPFKIKKEAAPGDMLNVIIALGSIVAIVISIIALKETREEFTIERTPYIQIGQLIFDSIKPGNPVLIHYNLNNLGIVPVKILDGKFGAYPGNDNVMEDVFVDSPNFNPAPINLNSYSIKESPYMGQWTSEKPFSDVSISLINQGKMLVVFFGRVRYLNLINSKISLYTFKIAIYQHPRYGAQMLYNENTP